MAATGSAYGAPRNSTSFHFDVFQVHAGSCELFRNGQKVALQKLPMQFLIMLLQRAGEVVSREEVRAQLWAPETNVDFEAGVATALHKVRQVLGDSKKKGDPPKKPQFVETLPGVGFRFIAGVRCVNSEMEAAETHESPPRALAPEGTVRWYRALNIAEGGPDHGSGKPTKE
jgi:DNA-binding winged helix-turn-helix (wHTH) protein